MQAAVKLNSDWQIESFDGFVMLRAASNGIGMPQVVSCGESLKELAAKKESLVFIDLSHTPSISKECLEALSKSIGEFKARSPMELVLVTEPELAARIQTSPLGSLMEVFEKQDEGAKKLKTQQVLKVNQSSLEYKLKACTTDSINKAIRRWCGQDAKSVVLETANVNPSTDIVAVVVLNADGCFFKLHLSSTEATLRKLVSKILDEDVKVDDPAVTDGACELLNYLTAHLRQHLSQEMDSTVDATPPRLLQPDEMMPFLDLNISVNRVDTEFGTLDVWMEEM